MTGRWNRGLTARSLNEGKGHSRRDVKGMCLMATPAGEKE